MVSKWILGGLAAAGVSAGFALAGPPRPPAPSLSSAAQVGQLYHDEMALSAKESHLQQLLGFARTELSRPKPSAPAAAPAPQAVLVASPASSAPVQPAAAPSPSRAASGSLPVAAAAPASTTTTAAPATTTTVAPAPTTTTTTTTPPTTTTTRPRGVDGGGSDD